MPHQKRFETARTRELRAGERSVVERNELENIEEFGCFVLTVDSKMSERWAYTIGAFNTSGRPELITVGLAVSTGHAALNEAVQAQRDGTDLQSGRHGEIVGKVDVIFRPVSPEWKKRLMLSAGWFNGGWDFPALQLIYPDLEGRFQWEDGFNEDFRQPLLQADAPETKVEEDFRNFNDPEGKFFDWKFPDRPHTSAILSKTVHKGEEPVTLVSHDAEDGTWQFVGDTMSGGGGPVVSCLHHPIDADPTLKELADLPLGWYAERNAVGEPWVRHQHKPEEE